MKATSIDLYFMILFLIVRKFVKQNNTLGMALLDGEKFEFVANSVSWIEGRNIMDSCFTLNFGYDAPLPWPQVKYHNMCILWIFPDLMTFDNQTG